MGSAFGITGVSVPCPTVAALLLRTSWESRSRSNANLYTLLRRVDLGIPYMTAARRVPSLPLCMSRRAACNSSSVYVLRPATVLMRGFALNMCLLSMFGTFRDCCSSREVVTGLQSLALSLAHATALALRSKGCSDVLLDGGSAITMGGVVLGSCFTEGTASSLIPSASDTVGEGTVRPERWE